MNYIPIIGLETHIELKTASKMFCGCSADYFGAKPNTHTCPVCLGLPGALPVANKQAIEWCIMLALSLNCEINQVSKFDRKNYFYPDLPKGYQISQYDLPFGHNGNITLTSGRKVGITRVHMEEDTGKLMHRNKESLIDFNRSSVPLVEIVTEPEFHAAEEVKEYLQRLQQIVRYLGISNADMEKGDMRLEPNISLCRQEIFIDPLPHNDLPNYKVEVKNINSFKFVEKAILFETERQAKLLDAGQTPPQETRGWNDKKNETFSQRIKEEANDYRYFPEPDIPPIIIEGRTLSTLKSSLPELPGMKKSRFIKQFSLPEYDAEILTREQNTAGLFEQAVKICLAHGITAKQIANLMINKRIDFNNTTPEEIVNLLLSARQKETLSEKELESAIHIVFTNNEKAVNDYKSGKENVIMYLVGQVMKEVKGKADANTIKEKLVTALANDGISL